MRVGVIHNTLNAVGGAERVCLSIIEALKEHGHEVKLVTIDRTNWGKVSQSFGDVVRPDQEYYLSNLQVPLFGIYQRFLTTIPLLKIRSASDVLINTHGDCLPVFTDIVYVHFPTFTMDRPVENGDGMRVKYATSLFWKLYHAPYRHIQSSLIHRYLGKATKIVTNSLFSLRALQSVLGRTPHLMHPPCDISSFRNDSHDREDIVVTTSRITPEKGLETLPMVASKTPDVRYYLIGATNKLSGRTLSQIELGAKTLEVHNLKVLTNLPLRSMVDLYRRAKVYLHTMPGEHFGISVVEAMAAGLVPVVHRCGGCYTDIIEEGRYGYGWENTEECASYVKEAMANQTSRSEEVKRRAEEFSKERFKARFMDEVFN